MGLFPVKPLFAFLLVLLFSFQSMAGWAQDVFSGHAVAAKRYMSTKQWDFASYEWRNVLETDPANIEANIGLAQSLMNSGYTQDAIVQLQGARKQVKNHGLDIALAEAYYRIKRYKESYSLYKNVLETDPRNVQAFRGLYKLGSKLPKQPKIEAWKLLQAISLKARRDAEQAMAAGDYKKAVHHYDVAILMNNKDTQLMNDYGLALLLSGSRENAYQQFSKLRSKKNNHWIITANSALADLSVGKTKDAVTEMEAALGLCTDNSKKAQLYNNLGYIYESHGKYTKARYAYERALEYDPTLNKARMNLAYILQKTGDLKSAEDIYREVLKNDPNNAQTWNALGFICELMYRSDKAIAAYKRAIEIDPKYKEAYFNLGTHYKKMGEDEKSMEVYRTLSTLEFDELENTGPKKNQVSSQAKLMDYIDLFFFNPALAPKQTLNQDQLHNAQG